MVFVGRARKPVEMWWEFSALKQSDHVTKCFKTGGAGE